MSESNCELTRRQAIIDGTAPGMSAAKRLKYISRWVRGGIIAPADAAPLCDLPAVETVKLPKGFKKVFHQGLENAQAELRSAIRTCTESPTPVQQAKNFIVAATRHAMDGFHYVDDAEVERRMSLCRACPMFNTDGPACRLCGCDLSLKTKWRSSTCPLEKW